MKPLAAQTPQEIDTELARLAGEARRAENGIAAAFVAVHSRLGERRTKINRHLATWPTSDTEAEAKLRGIVAAGDTDEWQNEYNVKALTRLDTHRAELATLNAAIDTLDAEFERRGRWSRFFLVHNGHIHSSQHCSTCYPTTEFGWLPTVSGKTEAEAVAEHGTRLCSVCFPSAPVEWTAGVVKPVDPALCTGQGQYAPDVDLSRFSKVGTCPVCGTKQSASSTGKMLKHKRPIG